MQAYCMKCRAKREMKHAKAVVLKNGSRAVQGICPVCGSKLFRLDKGEDKGIDKGIDKGKGRTIPRGPSIGIPRTIPRGPSIGIHRTIPRGPSIGIPRKR